MNTFDIFSNSSGQVEVVKQGFSWPGFFFTWIWGYLAKLWIPATILLIIALILSPFFLSWIVGFASGIKGNEWRRDNLKTRGFDMVASIEAESSDAAKNEFTLNNPNSNQASSMSMHKSSKDTAAQLQDIKKLFDDGVLSEDEYENKRSALVSKL